MSDKGGRVGRSRKVLHAWKWFEAGRDGRRGQKAAAGHYELFGYV